MHDELAVHAPAGRTASAAPASRWRSSRAPRVRPRPRRRTRRSTSGVAGRIEHPAGDRADRVQPVAGSASRRRSCRRRRGSPRTGRVVLARRRRRTRPSAVTTSAREQVVDRQPVLAHEIADPAAERDPADPDRAGVAEPDREPVLPRRRSSARRRSGPAPAHAVSPPTSISSAVQLATGRARSRRRSCRARAAVAAAADRKLEARCACDAMTCATSAASTARTIAAGSRSMCAGNDLARVVVLGVTGRDDVALEVRAEVVDRERFVECGSEQCLHVVSFSVVVDL